MTLTPPELPRRKIKQYEWHWLDDLEYFIKIMSPMFVLLIGLFGNLIIDLPGDIRQTLITAGLFALGMTGNHGHERR